MKHVARHLPLLAALLVGCDPHKDRAPLRATGKERLANLKTPGIGPEIHGLGWVRIGRGRYWIGTPLTEAGREKHEIEPMQIEVERPYFISTTEVPQGLYRQFVADASWELHRGDAIPAHSLDFDDANRFCDALDSAFPGWDFALPTESEWEIAARGAPRSEARLLPFTCNDARLGEEPAQVLKGFAFYRMNSEGTLRECGSKNANPIGLYDVHGNVFEWCRPDETVFGPSGTTRLSQRPLRGGSYLSAYRDCRAGSRAWERRDRKAATIGIRLVCYPR